jgi:DNA polymerase-3 subunit epsilon
MPTGRTFQCYVNPERDMPDEALSVHGLTAEFLVQHPVFADVVQKFLEFIGDSPLVIHNADFDLRFVNAELKRLDMPAFAAARAIDTVTLARRKFPGAPASLDALCRRYQIDLSDRSLHGALKDARLLAHVYLELIGGRQPGFALAAETVTSTVEIIRIARPPRPHAPSADEAAAHARFLERLKAPIWMS